MTEDEHKLPTTVRELGIQFDGFSKLVDERFENLTDTVNRLALALEQANYNKADQKDLDLANKRITALEGVISTIKNRIAYGAVIVLVAMVLGAYGITQF